MDSSEEEDLALLSVVLLDDENRRKTGKRRFWVREIFRLREKQGVFSNLLRELRLGDREYFFKYMRMTPNRFEHLFTLVGPRIEKKTTRFREPISAPQRLSLTLRFLATRESQQSLSLSYRIGKSTVSKIVSETSLAIYNSLKDSFLKKPSSKEEWLFNRSFQEGLKKHGIFTYYHNYKGFFSIVLLAMCDINYCFTLIDLGHYGSNNDSGVENWGNI